MKYFILYNVIREVYFGLPAETLVDIIYTDCPSEAAKFSTGEEASKMADMLENLIREKVQIRVVT